MTAIEWLEKRFYFTKGQLIDIDFDQAKEMEKEQIMSAFDFGVYDGGGIIKKYEMSGEQYYNETFKPD